MGSSSYMLQCLSIRIFPPQIKIKARIGDEKEL